jgi:probable HAF family extracellular repeat protein
MHILHQWHQFRFACLALLLTLIVAPVRAQSFQGLGSLPGGEFNNEATAISGNGRVVVGQSRSIPAENEASLIQAFRWTEATGMVGLGDLPGGAAESGATAVSTDGSVVVGYGISGSGLEAFRWTQAAGMAGLGDLTGGGFFSYALGVSGDGAVVVGYSESASGFEAFRWTQAGGMAPLGDLPGGAFQSVAYGVSGNGNVVVGYSGSRRNNVNGYEAFRWTQAGGMVGLNDLPGGGFDSEARAASADGSVVVGYGTTASGQEAFRWTQAGGMQPLGLLPGTSSSRALSVSADGSVVVGVSGQDPFIWTAQIGMQPLKQVLADLEVDFTTGWRQLLGAVGISADGTAIVGSGRNAAGPEPNGRLEPWIARIPGAPKPAAAHLLWQHTDGRASVWRVAQIGQQAEFSSGREFSPPAAGSSPHALAVSPADQTVRLLWRHADGAASVWSLKTDLTLNRSSARFGPFAGWTAVDLSVGGDNRTRLLWRHTDGRVSVWLLDPDGTFRKGEEFGPLQGWEPIDMDVSGGDNRTRLLWRHTDGRALLWFLRPDVTLDDPIGGRVYGPFPGWTPIHLAVTADDRTHLLWRHTDGRASLWTLRPIGLFESGKEHGPFPGWTIETIGTRGNKPRLLWRHMDGHASAWFLSGVTSFTPDPVFEGGGEFGPYPGWTPIQIQ